jgi:hypothetical protein
MGWPQRGWNEAHPLVILRFAQCHPERSEGSRCPASEILR